MIQETIDVIVNAFESPEYGVNANLRTIEYDEDRVRVPSVEKFFAQGRDSSTSHSDANDAPYEFPVVALGLAGPLIIENGLVGQDYREARVPLEVVIYVGDVDQATQHYQGFTIGRAVLACLHDLFRSAAATDRTLRCVTVRRVDRILHGDVRSEKSLAAIGAALQVDLIVRDFDP